MKKYLLIILLLSTSFFYSQTAPENEIKISDVSLPSAQAFEMTKRGSVPVDESSGRLGLNIPLGNLIEGDINVPITLNYSGPGVKMSDVSTWTGTNWNLNAGGLITRIVKDLPDDSYKPKIYNLINELGANPSDDSLFENQYKLSAKADLYDSQYDIFAFSFLNYSGEFVIKRENDILIPQIINNKDNLKIELIGNFYEDQNYSFIMTDTNGTKYYFGNNLYPTSLDSATGAAIEETQINDRPQSNRRNKKYKSAFYLTKIESYKGDNVFFEYYRETMYKNYIIDQQYINQIIGVGAPAIDMVNIAFCNNSEISAGDNLTFLRFIDNRIFNGLFLKKIRGSNDNSKQIIFESYKKMTEDKTNIGGANLLKYRILTGIFFNDKKINLEYYPSLNQILNETNNYDRFFLTDVRNNNLQNENLSNNYRLEYFNLNQIPLNINMSQDHMGFYNGIINSSLLPNKPYINPVEISTNYNNINPIFFNFNSNNYNLADREPRFNQAIYGTLKKIIYPEKGWTEIEYEPVIKKKVYEAIDGNIFHKRQGSCLMKNEFVFTNIYLGDNGETFVDPYIPASQEVNVVMELIGTRTPGVSLDYRDYVYLKITDLMSQVTIEKKLHLKAEDINPVGGFGDDLPDVSGDVSATLNFSFNYESTHSYKIEFGFGDNIAGKIENPNSPNLSNISGFFTFSVEKGLDLEEGLGIRVKRTKDYSDTTKIENVKRYYYKEFHQVSNLYVDNAINYFKPYYLDSFIFDTTKLKNCTGNCEDSSNKIAHLYVYAVKLISDNIKSLLPSRNIAAIYKNVTISYGGDYFENGGIQKNFHIEFDGDEEDYKVNNGEIIHNYVGTGCSPLVYEDLSLQKANFEMKSFNSINKTNYSNNNGLLLSEYHFINKNGIISKNKVVNYSYSFVKYDILNSFNPSVEFNKFYNVEPCINNVYIGRYQINFYKPYLKEIETIEYIDLLDYRQFISTYYHKGDSHKDFDNDGILNFMDEDYIITFEEYESDRKKITTKVTYDYSQTNMVNMANEIVKTSSDSSIVNKQKIYYPIQNQISLLSNLNSNDLNYYTSLTNAYRISQPIQMESFQNNEKLTSSRLLYGTFNSKIMPRMVQKSKGQQSWFSTDEITNYDSKFNMSEIKNLETNIFTSFKYTNDGLPLCKAYNLTINQLNSNWSQIADYTLDPNGATTPNANNIYDLFPSARFKFFKYDIISRKLIEEKDENKQIKTYLYDSFFNLKTIKDHDGNIIKEFDQQFKPQN